MEQVPFVDFFNHESSCRALLSYDEGKACAEVISSSSCITVDYIYLLDDAMDSWTEVVVSR
jgi:LSD1 subclass zinc finger protein